MERFAVPQGRVIGGGSSVNAMIYMRGQARDYDDWIERHGCNGWGYQDVLPVYKRQESNTRLADPYHGTTGPLIVADPEYKHPVTAAAIEAALQIGLLPNEDFNGAEQEGAGWYQATAHQGRRRSAAVCFLRPVMNYRNLTVLTNFRVERLRIENRQARAVEARQEGSREVVIRANKEIVLTAGSFNSPKLLMLSGIGPKLHLDQLGIETHHDAPAVGGNYQDHVGVPVTRKLRRKIGLHGADQGLKAMRHGLEYLLFRRGLLISNLLEAGACVDTDGDGRPDVQFNFAPFAPGRPGALPLSHHAMHLHPMTMRPQSRGRLLLRSSDPAEPLRFEANVLGHEDDLDTLRRGVRLAREIYDAPALRDMVGEEIWPGTSVSSAVGSNSLDDAIREQARTIFHPAGTCRLGSDEDSVLDLNLRVRGIENLRVADCSVMPALVSGNTMAPTMMIADRAADFILLDA
jgi:choline dehydrogenase-like flavoprotein